MRWPWRRERRQPHVAVPAARAPSWAEAARPPAASWAESAQPPAGTPVRLGFDDGSEVQLDAAHPSAVALRAVADLLVQDPPAATENYARIARRRSDGGTAR